MAMSKGKTEAEGKAKTHSRKKFSAAPMSKKDGAAKKKGRK